MRPIARRVLLTLALTLGFSTWLGSLVRADVRSGGIGTRVNGNLEGVCRRGICRITGGSDAGKNRFHRFSAFDTRGAIKGVNIDTGGKSNLIVGVTASAGTYLDKLLSLSSPANLFWLSPGGIHLGSGVGFVNVQQLKLSTANSLRFHNGVFDVFGSSPQQLAALVSDPLSGSQGFVDDPARRAELGLTATPRILLQGIDVSIDKSLLVDAPSGGVEVVGSRLSVSSADGSGGNLTLTGDQVKVDGSSKLLATGATGGGLIQVGGSWQNSDQTVRQALHTTVEPGALFDASATDQGHGGTIVAWSDIHNPNGLTSVAGSLVSRGGSLNGNGGKIETSGAYLDVDQVAIDVGSVNGEAGEWLLDPFTYTIDNSSQNAIQNALIAGANVAISTSVKDTTYVPDADISTVNAPDGDINVDISLDWSGGSGTLQLTADDTVNIANGVTVTTGSGGLAVTTAKLTGDGNVNVASGGTFVVNQSGTSTYNGVIAGAGGLQKKGAGNLTLTGAQTFTGNTSITAGTLTMGAASGLSSSTDLRIDTGATLSALNDLTIRSLSGSGTYNMSGTTTDLRINIPSGVTETFSGVIQADNATSRLLKQGPGTQVLAGANTYDGETYVDAGILRVSNAAGLGTTTQETLVRDGATLEFAGGATLADEMEVGEQIKLNYNGGPTDSVLRAFSGYTEITDTVMLEGDSKIEANASSFLILDPSSSATAYAVAPDATLCTSTNTCNLSVGGAGNVQTESGHGIDLNDGTDSFTLTKVESGTLLISGKSDITQTIDIQEGTFQVAHKDAFGTSTAINLGSNTTAATLKFSVNMPRDSTAATTTLTLGALGGTFDVDLGVTVYTDSINIQGGSANNGFTKDGGGELILEGVNTYSGPTTVTAGTLTVNSAAPASATCSSGASSNLCFSSGGGGGGDTSTPTSTTTQPTTPATTATTTTVTGGTTEDIDGFNQDLFDDDVAEVVAVVNSAQTQLLPSLVGSAAIERITVGPLTVIEGGESADTQIDSTNDEFDKGAVQGTPQTIAANGLEVDLSLNNSFEVVDNSTYGATVEAGGESTSSVNTRSDTQAEAGGAKIGEGANSAANNDSGEGDASAAEAESGEFQGGATDSVASSAAVSAPSSVTKVTSAQATANVAKADAAAMRRTVQALNLPDLADRPTPTSAQLQEGMQRAVERFGSRP
ncbi:beta strand repeat-containing protein [Prochlorococcus marinus]|uniref:beta strand repeat-containing protein n=1 Tax=Prochlorococcus TaxID=1218 RepID=UPI0018C86D6E|nr:autotransporter-associated beta strand repeat-containing protein [Prochlorococcus marinus]